MDTFIQAKVEHCVEVGRLMREADAMECVALGLDPRTAPLLSLRTSPFAATWMVDGLTGAMFGYDVVQPDLMGPRRSEVWLLTTKHVDTHPLSFWRASKVVIESLRFQTDVLWQFVDARHAACLRWVRALGFTVFPPVPHGPHGLPFHLVEKRF